MDLSESHVRLPAIRIKGYVLGKPAPGYTNMCSSVPLQQPNIQERGMECDELGMVREVQTEQPLLTIRRRVLTSENSGVMINTTGLDLGKLKEPLAMMLSDGTKVLFQVRIIQDNCREHFCYNKHRDIMELLYSMYTDPASYPRPRISRTTDGRMFCVYEGERDQVRNVNTLDPRKHEIDPWSSECFQGPPPVDLYQPEETGPSMSVISTGNLVARTRAANENPPEFEPVRLMPSYIGSA